MQKQKEELAPKRGTGLSVVWNWFGLAASDLRQTVCLKAVVTKDSSMTNLFQHLKQRHSAKRENFVRHKIRKIALAHKQPLKNSQL